MNFFKKLGVGIATLVLSVAAAVTIGKVREANYTQPESSSIHRVMKDYQDEEGFAELTDICGQYVIDNADVIEPYETDAIVNTIANMAVRDDGVVAVATEKFAEGAVQSPGDLKKTAERLYDRLNLNADEGAIMVIDTESGNYYLHDPSGKIFADMSDAELRSVDAALKKGFEEARNGNATGIGVGIESAYDDIARIISDPASFQNMQNAYVVEEDGGSMSIVEKTVGGGVSIIKGIVKTATGIVSGVFRVIGGSSLVIIIVIAGIVILVKSTKKKNNGDKQDANRSGQGGRPGHGGRDGQPGQPGVRHLGDSVSHLHEKFAAGRGRNLSQSGNIDTSKISTEGSTYRWSANKNPYSGLNKGRSDQGQNAAGTGHDRGNNTAENSSGFAGSKDMSGFVFPSDFGSSEGIGQNNSKPQN